MKILSKRAREKKNFWTFEIKDFVSTEAKLKYLGISPKFLEVDVTFKPAADYLDELRDDYEALVGYKGQVSDVDAGYFFAPYIPTMVKETITAKPRQLTEKWTVEQGEVEIEYDESILEAFYEHTTPLQKSVNPKLSVVWECGVSHRLGWSGDR